MRSDAMGGDFLEFGSCEWWIRETQRSSSTAISTWLYFHMQYSHASLPTTLKVCWKWVLFYWKCQLPKPRLRWRQHFPAGRHWGILWMEQSQGCIPPCSILALSFPFFFFFFFLHLNCINCRWKKYINSNSIYSPGIKLQFIYDSWQI